MATQAEKDFFNFIQKRVKNNYKYKGFSVYNLTAADISKLKELGDKWGIPFEWLCNLMNHESAGTFNPAIKNSIGATGLIQFLTSTAKSLGTTTSVLASLSFQGQLEWVDKYLDGWKSTWKKRGILTNGKANDKFQQPDLFMTIFYPAAIGKPDFQFNADVQKANGGIKTPMDYARKALDNPPFPIDKVPSTLPEYRRKISGGDAGAIPGGDTGGDTGGSGTGETGTTTPAVPPSPPIPPIPKIEENGVRFNVEQKDMFKAINAKHNFGELFVVEEVPQDEMFVFQEEDLSGLSDEYKETGFIGEEESPSDIPEVDTATYDAKPDEGSNQVNNPTTTTTNGTTTGPVSLTEVPKVPTGRSAYSHNETQGYNLTNSLWYGDLLTSALAHIEHPTFDIPGTEKGSLGCASWVSMVFYRAFGVHMRDGKPVKKIPKSVGDFGSLGTGELGAWFGKNPTMWEKIPWKEGKPGDVINTERGSSAGHVGIVLNEMNKNGTYTVASNSSGGFGNKADPLGCGKKNYSIKTWESVTQRNPSKTFCWRYKGPKLKPGETA
jgi:hypothetical protein